MRTRGGGFLVGNRVRSFSFLSCRQRLRLLLWVCGQRACVVHISTASASQCGGAVVLDRHRRPVSQRPMKALCVVKVDPSGNAGLGFVPVGIVLQIDVLVFAKASSSASTQNEASIVFDSRHDSTARL